MERERSSQGDEREDEGAAMLHQTYKLGKTLGVGSFCQVQQTHLVNTLINTLLSAPIQPRLSLCPPQMHA